MALLDQDGTAIAPTKPQPIKVVICIPTRGECKAGFALDLARLVNMTARRAPHVSIAFVTGTGTLIHDLRSKIARDALHADPDYLFWTLGDVIDDMADFPNALDEAAARHSRYIDAQRERLAESIGGDPAGAARRGAEAIARFLAKDAAQDKSGG